MACWSGNFGSEPFGHRQTRAPGGGRMDIWEGTNHRPTIHLGDYVYIYYTMVDIYYTMVYIYIFVSSFFSNITLLFSAIGF